MTYTGKIPNLGSDTSTPLMFIDLLDNLTRFLLFSLYSRLKTTLNRSINDVKKLSGTHVSKNF